MWGDLDPQWQLLKSQLETKGPGWYSPAEREERLFTNKSIRPGDDVKEALRTDRNTAAWEAWSTTQYQLRQLRQPNTTSLCCTVINNLSKVMSGQQSCQLKRG